MEPTPNEVTPGERVLASLRLNRRIYGSGFLLLCTIIAIDFIFTWSTYTEVCRNHREAIQFRGRMLDAETHNEQMLVEHMKRTVERWETLQKANPQLSVKQIPEPVP